MSFSQISVTYNPERMCYVCWASKEEGLGVLSCCKKSYIHHECWDREVVKQSERKK